jgi:hypothetical protein
MINVRYVVIVRESFFYLLDCNDTGIAGVYGSKRFSHRLKIDVHIARNVVNNKF